MEVIEYFTSARQEHWRNEIGRSDWAAGRYLYELLEGGKLRELCGQRTRLLLLVDGDRLIAFCTYAERDEIRDTTLTPWVGFAYTFPEYRGARNMGILLEKAEALANSEGFPYIYISTGETNLYEKYGYEQCQKARSVYGEWCGVYRKRVGE